MKSGNKNYCPANNFIERHVTHKHIRIFEKALSKTWNGTFGTPGTSGTSQKLLFFAFQILASFDSQQSALFTVVLLV